MRVQIHELRVQIHELRVQIHELQVQIHELRIQIHKLRVQIHELRVQIHESLNQWKLKQAALKLSHFLRLLVLNCSVIREANLTFSFDDNLLFPPLHGYGFGKNMSE